MNKKLITEINVFRKFSNLPLLNEQTKGEKQVADHMIDMIFKNESKIFENGKMELPKDVSKGLNRDITLTTRQVSELYNKENLNPLEVVIKKNIGDLIVNKLGIDEVASIIENGIFNLNGATNMEKTLIKNEILPSNFTNTVSQELSRKVRINKPNPYNNTQHSVNEPTTSPEPYEFNNEETKKIFQDVFPRIKDKDLNLLVSRVKSKFPTNELEFQQYIKIESKDYKPEYKNYINQPSNIKILWNWYKNQKPIIKKLIWIVGTSGCYPILKSMGINFTGISSFITGNGKQALYDMFIGIKKGISEPIDKSGNNQPDTPNNSGQYQNTEEDLKKFLKSIGLKDPNIYTYKQNGNIWSLNDVNNTSYTYENGEFK